MEPRKVQVKAVAELQFALSLTLGEMRDMLDSLVDWPNSSPVTIDKIPVVEGAELTSIQVVKE